MALLNVDYTQKKFWGGSYYSYWSVLAISVIFGFLGLDHLYLRSPLTFLLKAITNMLTFGLWFFYDIIQLASEKETVMEHGLRAPILGPLGVGAGMFRDNDPSGPEAKSPFRFLGFVLALFIPGMSYAFAGDTNGGMAQFASMLFPPLWLILIGWIFYTAYRTFFKTKSLFSEGMPRIFPWNWWVMDEVGANYLGPNDILPPKSCEEDAGGFFGFIQRILKTILSPILGPLTETILGPYGQAIKATGQTLATTATAAGEIVTKTAEGAKQIVDLAVDTGIPIAKTGVGIASIVGQGPDLLQGTKDQVLRNLEGYKNVELLGKIADGKVNTPSSVPTYYTPPMYDGSKIGTVSMVGGGIPDLPIAPFLAVVGIVIGAGAIAFLRYGKKTHGNTKGPDDKPPQPTVV